jgi:hypothetical protein
MKKRTPRRPKLTLPERAAKLKPAWFDLNNYSASAKLNEMEWFIQIAFRRRVDIELRYRLQKAEPDNVILREMLELLQTQPIVSFQSISKIGGGIWSKIHTGPGRDSWGPQESHGNASDVSIRSDLGKQMDRR